jgi:membrane-associated phospholipid phosphatase
VSAHLASAAPSGALHNSLIIAVPASAILAATTYLLTLGGGAMVGLRAPILNAVPLCFGLVLLLGAATRSGTRAARAAGALQTSLIVVALGLSLACLSYVCASTGLPLRDKDMIWADRFLGFDWLRLMTSLDEHRALLVVLDAAYSTFTAQLLLAALALLLADRRRDLDRFIVAFVCASIFAESASILCPTLGPMFVVGARAHFANVPMLGRETAQIVLALRSGTLDVIDFQAIDGIISFPSLHAAVAVLVPWALRWSKPLLWPVVILDCAMFLSAVPCGNHYLADVIGGLAVAVLAIMSARPLHRLLEQLAFGAFAFKDARQRGAIAPQRQ